MKLADETYGQARQMTITEGPDVNAEDRGHWYSPSAVAQFITEEREACAVLCDEIANATEPDDFALDAVNDAASAIRMRSNV
jgi:hypothetical protein